MSDVATADSGGEVVSVPVIENTLGANAPEQLSPNQAAKALADLRWKRNQEAQKPSAESAPAATAEQQLSGEDNAAPEVATGETQEVDAASPPLDPPRSWTKEQNDRWSNFDRATQEFLLEHEKKITSGVNRSLSEAAEVRKAAEAERLQAEQVRKQYESRLPSLVKTIETTMQQEFGDIQSIADVRKMQAEDPFRFQTWQLRQMELAAAQKEQDEADRHKAQERISKRNTYEAEQNKRLIELVPEMAEPAKAATLRERAVAMLNDDLGLSNDQLGRWMQDDTGHEILSNAGIQKLMADGLKYRDLLNAPKAVVKPDLPPVQRPGSAKPNGAAVSERVQALDSKLTNSGSMKDAAALLIAKRNATRRAS
jgi:hypothetical protein